MKMQEEVEEGDELAPKPAMISMRMRCPVTQIALSNAIRHRLTTSSVRDSTQSTTH